MELVSLKKKLISSPEYLVSNYGTNPNALPEIYLMYLCGITFSNAYLTAPEPDHHHP